MSFVVERLDETHQLGPFRSGRAPLDEWLVRHALDAGARRTARTFVWRRGDRVVVAYYALTAHLLERAELHRSMGWGAPRQVPAVLLARLALDQSLHGQGLGGALLADALRRVVAATETVAARFVVVDALDDQAVGFYAHRGFQQIPESLRLVQKISDVAAAIS